MATGAEIKRWLRFTSGEDALWLVGKPPAGQSMDRKQWRRWGGRRVGENAADREERSEPGSLLPMPLGESSLGARVEGVEGRD